MTYAQRVLEAFTQSDIPRFEFTSNRQDKGKIQRQTRFDERWYIMYIDIGEESFQFQGRTFSISGDFRQLNIQFSKKNLENEYSHEQVPSANPMTKYEVIRNALGFTITIVEFDSKIKVIEFNSGRDERSRSRLYNQIGRIGARRLGWKYRQEEDIDFFNYKIVEPAYAKRQLDSQRSLYAELGY